jgi:hypothetical protein
LYEPEVVSMLLQAPSLLQEFGSSHSWGRWEGEKAQANEEAELEAKKADILDRM